MGGIAGINIYKGVADFDGNEVLSRMFDSMKHRAPYYDTLKVSDRGCLGAMRHDSYQKGTTIDHDQQKSIIVTIDGNIFSVKGRSFGGKNQNDAEMVLELYKENGNSFLEIIDGSYAVAIWDEYRKQLILARDRVGSKPLFYSKIGNTFIFASEIKAILENKICEKKIDLNALNHFLSYWYVPNPNTMFEEIKQIRPGHMLVFQGDNLHEKAYWEFTYKKDKPEKSETDYIERFLDIFSRAVSKRVDRYENFGAFLSGGLDTSSVVAMIHESIGRPFKVFTGGFRDEEFNEFQDAKIVSDHLQLEQFNVLIDMGNNFSDLLEKIVWYHDAPFVDTSAIPSFFTAARAKEHVDVVLTGDFPDQLIGGSGHQVHALSRQKNERFFSGLLRQPALNRLICKLPLSTGGASFLDKVKRKLYRETFSLEEQLIISNMPVPPLLKRRLYAEDFLAVDKRNDPLNYARALYREVDGFDLLDRILYFDTLSYAVDDLMIKVERMTMAHGLIAVSPFHDVELIEFVATLPSHLKINNATRKYILKEAVRPKLPHRTLEKKKKGFDMPIEAWLIKKYPDYVREILLDSRTLGRGYFKKDFLRKMVGDFLQEKTDYASCSSATIIALLTLEIWHRLFIDS